MEILGALEAIARTAIGTPYYLSPEVCQEKP
jgi:serine/threonine protein kinase